MVEQKYGPLEFDRESMKEYNKYSKELQEFVREMAPWYEPKPGQALHFFYEIVSHEME